MTRARTPGSLSTSTAIVCRSISVTRASERVKKHPSLIYALPRRKPGPIVPRHEPISVCNRLRLPKKVPSGGGMGPGFRRESEEDLLTAFQTRFSTSASDEHHAFFGDRSLGLVLGPEQHLVMCRTRRDHRKAILGRVDRHVED